VLPQGCLDSAGRLWSKSISSDTLTLVFIGFLTKFLYDRKKRKTIESGKTWVVSENALVTFLLVTISKRREKSRWRLESSIAGSKRPRSGLPF